MRVYNGASKGASDYSRRIVLSQEGFGSLAPCELFFFFKNLPILGYTKQGQIKIIVKKL